MKLLRDVVKKRSRALTAEDTDQLNQYRTILVGGRPTVDIPVRLEQRMCPFCLAITIGYVGHLTPSIHRPGCIHEVVRITNETT